MSSVEHDLAVCQAQGMICAQVGCTFDEALVLIRERAQVSGRAWKRSPTPWSTAGSASDSGRALRSGYDSLIVTLNMYSGRVGGPSVAGANVMSFWMTSKPFVTVPRSE